MRVVSLLPSATEICYALGTEPVAVSGACDYPPAARERPAVGSSRVADTGSSAAVNRGVAAAESAGGVYEVDRDALVEADPDLVLAQGVCEVCAVDGGLAREVVDELDLDASVLSLHSHSLSGVLEDVVRVGAAIGKRSEATALVGRLRDRIRGVEAAASDVPSRPRVAVLDWMEPVMVAGHWVPELVELAGGEYGLADPGDRSTPREWEQLRSYDPSVLIVAPCGFELERTVAHLGELTGREGWSDLAAVDVDRAFAIDGNHYVNRPGPRLIETLEFVAGLLHPGRFEAPPGAAVSRIAGKEPA